MLNFIKNIKNTKIQIMLNLIKNIKNIKII